jgi:hypothetical protein
MSEAYTGGRACGAIRDESGNLAALGAADWLCLAAAPTFAIMALLTGVLGGGAPNMLCSTAGGASPLSGMVPMYLLMSAFHSTPWLKLIPRRRSGVRRSSNRSYKIYRATIRLRQYRFPTTPSGATRSARTTRPSGEVDAGRS